MCRLLAVSSQNCIKPDFALKGLAAMREGYDGSGFGLLLKDLGGPFCGMKDAPILSGIFSFEGLKILDRFMMEKGFTTKYKITFKPPRKTPRGVPRRDVYLIRAYDLPSEWDHLDQGAIWERLVGIRLELKQLNRERGDMYVFSFWPDTVMIKEVGEPEEMADYLDLNRKELEARVILVQGRQNTNHQIDPYACHPFFLQGFSTMTNGENTAFLTNREYLSSRGFAEYNGYMSDSEVFTHILHYAVKRLSLGIEAFKHIITPLMDSDLHGHPDREFLTHLKRCCRSLIIDGPNCVIGCLPDNTLFMVQDRKKLRPGVIGRANGTFVMASEVCALNAVIPKRNTAHDFQPMHLDTAVVAPDRTGLAIHRQTDPLSPLQKKI